MNSSKNNLVLKWCSYKQAKYAVLRWHYSRKMPRSKLSLIGVWENERFVGTVIFGVGAGSSTSGKRYGMRQRWDIAELVRVALAPRKTPTSKIVAIAIRMIRKANPKLKLLISFADSAQGHVGTIYQASGWFYAGLMESNNSNYRVNGKIVPARTLHTRYGSGGQSIPWLRKNVDPLAERLKEPPKHRYLYPLTNEAKIAIEKFIQSYPKRADGVQVAHLPFQAEGNGALPISALQFSEEHGT